MPLRSIRLNCLFVIVLFFLFNLHWSVAQTISLSPNSGKQGTSFGVTVTGNNTNFLTSTTTCVQVFSSPNTLNISGITVPSTTTLTGNLSIPLNTNPGTYNARVYQGPGCTGNQYDCTNCFTVNPCDSVVMEDFQSKIIPVDWLNLDLDMNTDANGRSMNWYVLADAQTTTPGDTNWVVAASSWFNPLGKADNWLIIGPICIKDANTMLKWKSAPFEGPSYADGYQVRISTTDNNPASFTDTLATFAESLNGTATWGPGIQHPTFNGNSGVLAPWQFSLSDYVGESIYIAFQHDSDDDNLIMLDDIKIISVNLKDAAVTEASWPSEYYFAPLPEIRSCPLSLGCTVKNTGDTTITEVYACCRIYRNSNLLQTINSDTIAEMVANDEQNLTFPEPFPAVAEGIYTFEYIVKIEQNDTTYNNDTLRRTLIVNENILSRDNNVLTGALSTGTETSGILGQNFKLKHADTLYAADLFLATPTPGDNFSVVVYSANSVTGEPQNLIVETPDRFITMDDSLNPKIIRVTFPDPLALPAGAFYLGVRESVTGNISLGTATDIFTPSTSWIFLNSTWNTSELYGFAVSYVLRPIFGTCKDTLTLTSVIPGIESDITYRASWNINASDLIKTGATGIYYDSGGSIDLWPGFTVENGVTWQTMSNGCAEPENRLTQDSNSTAHPLIIERSIKNDFISGKRIGQDKKEAGSKFRGQ